MHRLKSLVLRYIKQIFKVIFYFCPVRENKVVFDNFFGKGYGDNPKYIAEQFMREHGEYDLVWLVKNKAQGLPKQIRRVRYGSIKALYELSTAKVFIDNIRNADKPIKKKQQIYVQTWHAGFPIKKIEGEVEEKLSKEYVRKAKEDAAMCDAILANDSVIYHVMKYYFWLKPSTEILKFGIPRNDPMFEEKFIKKSKEKARNTLKITEKNTVILYAPTFRDNGTLDGYRIDFDAILDAFEKRGCGKCALVVRMHPNVQQAAGFIKYSDRVVNGTFYPDIQELYCLADYVISDYSSVILEFAILTGKPAFICVPDYSDYINNRDLRDFFVDLPFQTSYSSEELLDDISKFDLKKYTNDLQLFLQGYELYDKGTAAEDVTEWIVNKMKDAQ